jgi:hypothetical protein
MKNGYRVDSRGIMIQFPVGARNFTLLQSILFSCTVDKENGAWSWPLTFSVELKNMWNYSSTPLYSFLACTGTTFLRFRKKEVTGDNYNSFTSGRWIGDWLWYGNHHRTKSTASAVTMQNEGTAHAISTSNLPTNYSNRQLWCGGIKFQRS